MCPWLLLRSILKQHVVPAEVQIGVTTSTWVRSRVPVRAEATGVMTVENETGVKKIRVDRLMLLRHEKEDGAVEAAPGGLEQDGGLAALNQIVDEVADIDATLKMRLDF